MGYYLKKPVCDPIYGSTQDACAKSGVYLNAITFRNHCSLYMNILR